MAVLPLPPQARRILGLAGADRKAARAALAELSLEDQVALVCTSPASRRGELIGLAPAPEALVPRLPEAELCFSVTGLGVEDAAWILEHATADQLVACFDLDAWHGDEPARDALELWLGALAEAGPPTLLRAARALDPELLALELRARIEVWLKPAGDDAEDWSAPSGAQTLEGQFYYRARRENDDLADVSQLLDALFRDDYWLYFRLLQAVDWESEAENAVWAERWRTGRLQDLGFPPRQEAIAIYAWEAPERLAALPAEAGALDVEAWRLPVWQPSLPVAPDARHSVFRAAAELGADERAAFLYGFLSLANAVAVADRMPLGDAASTPDALQRAAEIASAGLEFLAREHGLPEVEVLRRTPLPRLFRVGVNLRGEKPPESA